MVEVGAAQREVDAVAGEVDGAAALAHMHPKIRAALEPREPRDQPGEGER